MILNKVNISLTPYNNFHKKGISVNIALASPLLSRFDLVIVLIDDQDIEWDKRVSSFILEGQMENTEMVEEEIWNLPLLRAYIAHIKTINPELTPESKEILTSYYKKQRKADLNNSARTTIRLLESLIRLAQAHARLMFRDKVLIQDAVVAVSLMECSMFTSALVGVSSALHSIFPEDPETDYIRQESLILKNLGLLHLLENCNQNYKQENKEEEFPQYTASSQHSKENFLDDSDDDDKDFDFTNNSVLKGDLLNKNEEVSNKRKLENNENFSNKKKLKQNEINQKSCDENKLQEDEPLSSWYNFIKSDNNSQIIHNSK